MPVRRALLALGLALALAGATQAFIDWPTNKACLKIAVRYQFNYDTGEQIAYCPGRLTPSPAVP